MFSASAAKQKLLEKSMKEEKQINSKSLQQKKAERWKMKMDIKSDYVEVYSMTRISLSMIACINYFSIG